MKTRSSRHEPFVPPPTPGTRPGYPNPMIGHRGAPAGAPPMPWGRWLLGLIGIRLRNPYVPRPPK